MLHLDDGDLRRAMAHLGRQFGKDKVGRKIKRETSARLRKMMKPMVESRKTAVMRLPSKGHKGLGMRQAIARQTRASARWSAKSAGIAIIQRARGMPRDFQYAGRAFNREVGWNPRSITGETMHQEMRPVAWFDSVNQADRRVAKRELIQALDEVAGTLASEIRRIG